MDSKVSQRYYLSISEQFPGLYSRLTSTLAQVNWSTITAQQYASSFNPDTAMLC